MNDDQRLQVFTLHLDDSMTGYGYDGVWFNTHDDALANVLGDFTEPKQGVVGMRLVWGNAEEIKEIKPLYGQELIDAITAWLTELGVYNGN